MSYDYSPKVLQQWAPEAQAETYRLKFEHAEQERLHWQRRAASAEAQLSLYQAREKAKA